MDDATRTKVKRYVINCGELAEHPDGSLYHANDYDALAQKLDDAEREREAALRTESAWRDLAAERSRGLSQAEIDRVALDQEVARLREVVDIIKPTFEVIGDYWMYTGKDSLYCLFCEERWNAHDEDCIVPKLEHALAGER